MKVLIISADNFEDFELRVPYYRLKEEGIEVIVSSLSSGAIKGKHGYQEATDGRRVATGVIVAAFALVIALTGWAFFGPLKGSVTELSGQLPVYWERLQKPLIKMEQQAVLSEEKLQAEVTTEIARSATEEGKPEAARRATKQAPPETAKKSGSLRSSLSQMVQGVVGRFTAVAFNAAQILVVLVTVFFGVIFTLMKPRSSWKTM